MSFAAFKRKLKVGVKVKSTLHTAFAGRDPETGKVIYKDEERPAREISIAQTNSVAFKTERNDGEVVDSWWWFPKASSVEVVDENTIVEYEEDYRVRETELKEGEKRPKIKVLTYTILD